MCSLMKKMTKTKLYDLIKQHKENTCRQFQVDSYLQQHGHEVLRLPPYHCEFNPIELIWSDVKQYVARNNSTFKVADVKMLINNAFQQIDATKWKNACAHVQSVEELYWKKDNLQADTVNRVIIHISENDDDSDNSDETECEEGDADSMV